MYEDSVMSKEDIKEYILKNLKHNNDEISLSYEWVDGISEYDVFSISLTNYNKQGIETRYLLEYTDTKQLKKDVEKLDYIDRIIFLESENGKEYILYKEFFTLDELVEFISDTFYNIFI